MISQFRLWILGALIVKITAFVPVALGESFPNEIDRDCGDHFRVGEKCKYKISELHPTQGALGRFEVRRKLNELSKMSADEAESYRKKKIVPVVVGPDQKLYMVDHHHSSLALLNFGFESAYIEVIGDFSKATTELEFWEKMIAKNWAYPFDGDGQEISPLKIPQSLRRLEDDPYRSLAGIVRDLGGFKKEDTPYEEFIWARRFRELKLLRPSSQAQNPELNERDYARAANEALTLIDWNFWADPKSCADYLRKLLDQLPNQPQP
jgi:hypothetical protein